MDVLRPAPDATGIHSPNAFLSLSLSRARSHKHITHQTSLFRYHIKSVRVVSLSLSLSHLILAYSLSSLSRSFLLSRSLALSLSLARALSHRSNTQTRQAQNEAYVWTDMYGQKNEGTHWHRHTPWGGDGERCPGNIQSRATRTFVGPVERIIRISCCLSLAYSLTVQVRAHSHTSAVSSDHAHPCTVC